MTPTPRRPRAAPQKKPAGPPRPRLRGPRSAQASALGQPSGGTSPLDLLSRLAQPNERKIVLLVLDGVGGIHTAESPRTALERAVSPNLDRLAERSALGRALPVAPGVTPGSGPGHLALFGYDPVAEAHQIGRGVLEALGIGHELAPEEIAARGNFCTIDAAGRISDRRAGRPSDEECRRVAEKLDRAVGTIEGVRVAVLPVREHRFCLILRGPRLDPSLADTDPQREGSAPLPVRAARPTAERTARIVQGFVDRAFKVLKDEPRINALTLRGFSARPRLRTFGELYRLNPVAVAVYPLYRGVARLAGMRVVETGPTPADQFATVAALWPEHDFFFIHVKKTDSSGEDGNLQAKIAAIEAVDAALPALLDLQPDVLAVTGDHATPHVYRSHSWHPVPLLLHGPFCDVDQTSRFTESECLHGSLGTIASDRLMGLLLANAGKLARFGA